MSEDRERREMGGVAVIVGKGRRISVLTRRNEEGDLTTFHDKFIQVDCSKLTIRIR